MKRPNFNCIIYDTLIELNDLKTYLKDLNKYCDFIETENKRLKLCEVGVTLKDKKTPTFEDWLIEHKCVVTLNKNIFIKTGHSFHLKELERWYKEEFNL